MSTENDETLTAAMDDLGPDAAGVEPVPVAPATVHLTPELLQMLLTNQSAATIDAIREFKRLPADEQEKVDRERARKQEMTRARLIDQHRRDERQSQAWRNCSHRQPNGRTRFRAQGLSNGYTQAFCPECHYLSPPFVLAPHELTSGVNIGDWSGDVWATIQARVRASAAPPPIPELPPGARVIF